MHTGAGQTDQGGGVAGDQRTQPLLELGLLGVDGGDASGELTQHIAGVAHHGVRVVAVVEAAGPVKLLGGGQAAKRLADLARSGQQQRTELVQRPGAVLVRRLVQHLQDTHSLHHPVAGLGDARRRACHAARAAASASTGSDLPRSRRVLRSGRSTSTISTPSRRRYRASPAP